MSAPQRQSTKSEEILKGIYSSMPNLMITTWYASGNGSQEFAKMSLEQAQDLIARLKDFVTVINEEILSKHNVSGI